MNVRTMHKLEDSFSQQRPKETVIEIEALEIALWLLHKNSKPLSIISAFEMWYGGNPHY